MNNTGLIRYGYTFEQLCKDNKIGYQSIAIYDVLSTLAGQEYKCTTTVSKLCEMLQMSTKTFFKYQRPLLDRGYISSKHQGGCNGNVYTLELAKNTFKKIKSIYSKRFDDMEVLNLDVPIYYELLTGKKLTKDLNKLLENNCGNYENWFINYALVRAVEHLPDNNPVQVILYAKEIMNRWVSDPFIETKDDIDELEKDFHKKKQAEREGW